MNDFNKQIKYPLLRCLVVTAIVVVVQLGVGFLSEKILKVNNPQSLVLMILFANLIILGVVGKWYLSSTSWSLEKPRYKDIGGGNVFRIFLGLWLCGIIGNGILFITGANAMSDSYDMAFSVIGESSLWLQILTVVLIAPLVEEVAFRGIAFKGLRTKYGFWVSAIISTGLWSALHMDLFQSLAVFPTGLFLTYLYERFGKLWVPVLGHCINNFLATISLWALNNSSQEIEDPIADVTQMVSTETRISGVVLVVIGGLLMFLLVRGFKKSKYPQ